MKITKITLTNIRCFEKFEVDLCTEHIVKNWMVILGDNNYGKTSILRSIAIGLCEKSGVTALLAEIPDMIRFGEMEGRIRLDLEPNENNFDEVYIETIIKRSDHKEINVDQTLYPKDFEWENLFACAYGVGRGIFGTADVFEYAVTDSTYSLFQPNSALQNPELILRRIGEEMGNESRDMILRKIEQILMLAKNSIELTTRSGIMIKDYWGKQVQYGAMGDGYASTLTWIIDLYGWKLLYEHHMKDLDVSGIVIIDELEAHLHPKWQKLIIKQLSQQFPKVQFIVSTHSPLCVLGTTDLSDDECCITVLNEGKFATQYDLAKPPRGKRIDQILTSYLFELYSTSDNKIKQDIERYNHLLNIERNKSQEDEMKKLIFHLNETLGSAETELEKKVGEVLNDTINQLFKANTQKMSNNSPEKFELIRQLSDLLK